MKKIYSTIAYSLVQEILRDLENRKELGWQDYLLDNNLTIYDISDKWEKLICEELEEMII